MGGNDIDIELTADLAARAIIAAANAYGDCPVVALTAKETQKRRALPAAAAGLARAGLSPSHVSRVLGLSKNAIYTARSRATPAFRAAELAAMRAAEFATWRPDAGESLVEDSEHPYAAAEVDLAEAPVPEAGELLVNASMRVAVELEASTPMQSAERSRPTGMVIARVRPPQAMLAGVRTADRPTDDLVLEAIAAGALNTMSIASLIDRKEMAVASALRNLESQGVVRSEPVEDGPRRFVWMLAKAPDA